jgi:hypothetical protein
MGLSYSERLSFNRSVCVRGVREFATGDRINSIHWPTTARLGQLYVRDFDSEVLPSFDILLNLRDNWQTQEQFELAVSVVLSIIYLGFSIDASPKLYLDPPLESPTLVPVMSDLPQLTVGFELISEILTRVDPVTVAAAAEAFAEGAEDERDLLIVMPVNEPTIKSGSDGDVIVYPVQLCVIDRSQFAAFEEPVSIMGARRSTESQASSPAHSYRDYRKAAVFLRQIDGDIDQGIVL